MDIVQAAEGLQRDAREKRAGGDLGAAEKLLEQTIALLVPEHERLQQQGQGLTPDVVASEPARRVADLLADAYGSLAGILRRRGLEGQALKLYEEGKKLEEQDRYRITSTYNRVQWLVLSILLKPAVAATPQLLNTVRQMQPTVERAARAGDPWRYADLALLALVAGDRDDAFDALEVMKSLNPVADVYKSGLPVIERLSAVLPEHTGLRDARDWYSSELQRSESVREGT
jgi:hypothetical protein